ncbi:MAG TPA: hypothetical protein VI248_24630 [Kineosporiaceae bacterium]
MLGGVPSIRRLSTTSAAVSGRPSWKVTPSRSRTVHRVASSFGVTAVARPSS